MPQNQSLGDGEGSLRVLLPRLTTIATILVDDLTWHQRKPLARENTLLASRGKLSTCQKHPL